MSIAQRMVATNPTAAIVDQSTLAECLQACFDCAQACVACADACLGEQNTSMLLRCIGLNLGCADVCEATGRILSRQTAVEPRLLRAALEACTIACRLCGDECASHGEHGMEHCQICAEACRRCEQACQQVLELLAA